MLKKLLRLASILSLSTLIIACTSPTKIAGHKVNKNITALGQNSRVRHIVVHYTSANTVDSIKILSQKNVSSHYLISDEQPPVLYQFVDENQRAWHAGVSQWQGVSDLNTSSIGIEIVNAGLQNDGIWAPYQPAQIQMLQDLLHDLVQRHLITPANIVGHSDIAPQRKIDPGPLFPWAQLAITGLGRWYDESKAQQLQLRFEEHGLPSHKETQQLLQIAGYLTPQHGKWDQETKNVMAAFQMHYRPARYDGQPDAESVAILNSLLE